MELNEEDFRKKYALTKQYPKGLKEITDAVVGAVRNSILAFFASNIALSFLAVQVLQYLWALINIFIRLPLE